MHFIFKGLEEAFLADGLTRLGPPNDALLGAQTALDHLTREGWNRLWRCTVF